VILRYFSVYGPRQRPDIAFSTFCGAAVRDEPVAVFGDGRQTRDFTYVDDVVAATRAAAEADGVSGGVYNVGGGWRISLADALELIGELAARPLRVDHLAAQEGDVQDTGADSSVAPPGAEQRVARRSPATCPPP
jgi:UDP-glucuronate 4-epimerase